MDLNKILAVFEAALNDKIQQLEDSEVKEAMAYSLLAGGKRLRPLLLLGLMHDLGVDLKLGLDYAMALECVHCYSLVHDDLPCMDNDDMRRGKPTNHIVYGEAMALLAGDALLTYAFELASGNGQAVQSLAKRGRAMILGQEKDMKDKMASMEDLLQCYTLKTGALFMAAIEMAAVVANRLDLLPFATQFGQELGIVFQIQDDLLEVTQDSLVIGKSTGSDKNRAKHTVLSFMALPEARTFCDETFMKLEALLKEYQLEDGLVAQLLKSIDKRIK